jgi:Ca2+-binding RTX toxin-like protein
MVTKIDAIYAAATYGTEGADTIEAVYLKGDLIYGLGGDDIIIGDIGNDYLLGGFGNDTIYGGGGNDTMYGEDGNDIMFGGDGQDQLNGSTGNDKLYGEAGDDNVWDTDGDNLLDGGAGNDGISGGTGIDTEYGGDGNDWLSGGFNNDKLYGDAGDDSISTKESTMASSLETDYADGGSGIDTISYANITTTFVKGFTINLGVTTAQKIGAFGSDILLNFENVTGSGGDDTLIGNGGDNVLNGNRGADTLKGMGGNDILDGSIGVDVLNGGAGNDLLVGGMAYGGRYPSSSAGDVLTGGTGADKFAMDLSWTNQSGLKWGYAGVDTVTDFNHAAGDQIMVRKAFTFIGTNAFSHTGGAEVQVTTSGTTQIVNLDYTGDGVSDSTFNVLNAAPLIAADFII